MEPRRLQYVPQLDGLRAVAIGLVLLHHLPLAIGRDVGWLQPLSSAGWIGVDVFFALSGFLITGILLGTVGRPYYWRRFYGRRALRILPLYYAVLTLVFLTRTIGPALPAEARPSPLWFYGFFSNFWYAQKPESTDVVLEVTWSLSVEEQFYLVWPLLIHFLSRRVLVVALCGLVMAAPVFRHLIASGAPSLCHTLCRMDGLAFGCLAALWWFSARSYVPRSLGKMALASWGALLIIIALGGFQLEKWGVPTYLYALVPLATVTTILAVLAGQGGRLSRLLGWSPFVRICRVSFGLYLLHPLAFIMIHQFASGFGSPGQLPGPAFALLWGGLALAFAMAMAFMSYQVWEQKFLALKDRLDSASDAPSPLRPQAASGDSRAPRWADGCP